MPGDPDIDALTESVIEAQRDSIAMASAAYRNDPEGVAVIWNGNANKQRLVWHMSRLPALLLEGLARDYGETFDFAGQAEELLRGLPRTVEDVDKLIDGEQPFADEDQED